MNVILRAARAYWRLNIDIFEGLKRGIERAGGPRVIAAVVSLVWVVVLVLTGHSTAAMCLSLGTLLLAVLLEIREP